MKRQEEFMKLQSNIIQELLSIEEYFESNTEFYVPKSGITPVLKDLKVILQTDTKIDKVTLERFTFSIYRLTTEDFEFTKSQIGQKLLKLSTDIRKLSNQL